MKKIKILILLPLLCQCTSDRDTFFQASDHPVYRPFYETNDSFGRMQRLNIRPLTHSSYKSAQEYVNRVGQKIALVSDEQTNLRFMVSSDLDPKVYRHGDTIIISRGVLVELSSEAELAAVLSEAITQKKSKYGVNYQYQEKEQIQKNAEQKALEYMHRAGYDPSASILAAKKLNANADTSNKAVVSESLSKGQAIETQKYQKMLKDLNKKTREEIQKQEKSKVFYPDSIANE